MCLFPVSLWHLFRISVSIMACLCLLWLPAVSVRETTRRTVRTRPTCAPELKTIGPESSFAISLHPEPAVLDRCHLLNPFAMSVLWAWTHVQALPLPATPTGWPVPEFSVLRQLTNTYIYKFLYNPGLHDPVFSVSFILNFHVSLKSFGPAIISFPLESALLHLPWPDGFHRCFLIALL